MWFRRGCNTCKKELYITANKWEGHCLEISLQCSGCGNSENWHGSQMYKDGSAQINRDVARAWYTTGGEDGHYQHFAQQLNAGVINSKSYDATVNLLISIILEQEDKMYHTNIQQANADSNGTIIGTDVQHCRPQRAVGSAPFATATIINHTPGSQYGKILVQTHLYKQDMIQKGIKPTLSKDKLATEEALNIMANKLDKIQRGICDGIGSTNTLWNTIIHGSKHSEPILSYCGWHRTKNIAKDFKTKLLDHKTKLKQRIGNKQQEFTFPEFKKFGFTGGLIKGQWMRAQKKSEGDVETMEMEWTGIRLFYESMCDSFSENTQEAFDDWLEKHAKNMERYVHGDLTDLEEAFHRTGLKYWKKGKSYSKPNYVARRALAAMHWNENYGKQKGQNTYSFLDNIRLTFGNYLGTRSKGWQAKNSYTVQKSGVITHWT